MHLVSHIVADGENAQDRVRVLRFGDRVVLAIADGAGGRSGGAEAADLVIKSISECAPDLDSEDSCIEALIEADAMVDGDDDAGETTAVVAVVSSEEIFGASIGDSGAWVISNASIDDLSAHQNRRPFLGSGTAMPVGFSRPMLDGTLLIATDGLLKYTSRDRICSTVRKASFESLCKELVHLVRYPSGALPDDVAIALCRLV